MEFNTKQELYDYLNSFDFDSVKDTEVSSVYFLVESDNHIEPIYFFNFDGAWFESYCQLKEAPLDDSEVKKYMWETYYEPVLVGLYEHEMNMQRNGVHYRINNPHCFPFLPKKIKILDVFSDKKCLDWLLDHRNDTATKRYVRNKIDFEKCRCKEIEVFQYNGSLKGDGVPQWVINALDNGDLFYDDYGTLRTSNCYLGVDIGDYIVLKLPTQGFHDIAAFPEKFLNTYYEIYD